jgi:hypothetical protein
MLALSMMMVFPLLSSPLQVNRRRLRREKRRRREGKLRVTNLDV